MDEVVSAAAGTACVPPGIAVRYRPATASGLWFELDETPGGRVSVALGHCADPALAARLRTEITPVLRETGDPVAALQPAANARGAAEPVAVCAVIERDSAELLYSSIGGIKAVVVTPGAPAAVLDPPTGRTATMRLAPAATVLLCIPGVVSLAHALLEQIAGLHPDRAAEHAIDALHCDPDAALAVLYRQPPAPMDLTVPAEPASLATVRSHLRHWLAMTGVDAESAADTLLAVGEAASNATEHSVLGAGHPVELTVRAVAAGAVLRFTVSDNGRWKPPPQSPGHRGHGIRLINALVDDADLITDDRGTTVEMSKGWRQ